jgi:SAM-dependent methyltransferase
MDYHVVHTAVRVAGRRPSVSQDRDVVGAILECLLAGRPTADILIAGSADSGLLATVVRAARAVVPARLAGFRFTVIDRCGTPLEFCRRFGKRHGLALTTAVAGLAADAAVPRADVVLMHSVLRFLPATRHAAALAAIGRALKPGGRIVFSQRIGSEPSVPVIDTDRLLALAAAGTIALPEPEADFRARLKRYLAAPRPARNDYGDERGLLELFARAGLTVAERAPASATPGRLVAVLAPQ